jgi:hypothetical protein
MLENVDIVQVILIGIGLVVVASVLLKSDEDKKPTPTPSPVVPPPVVDDHNNDMEHDFMCMINKWYALKDCCHKQGMHDLCKILDEQVFPKLNTSHAVKPDEVQS